MSPTIPLEDQDTADIDPELAQAEADRLAGLLWAHVHLSRHTLDGLGVPKLRIACEALGVDTSKGR